MSRRAAALVVGLTVLLALAALVWWSSSRRPAGAAPAGEEPPPTSVTETTTADLYFPSAGGWLGTERRVLDAASSAEERAAQVARALLAGPTENGLQAPVGGEVELASLHLSDGIIYVDLVAAQPAPPVSGSRGELLAVYSFVNSILANVPEARGVVLLWNGDQRPTFAGHVDTTRPLPAERKWLARTAG